MKRVIIAALLAVSLLPLSAQRWESLFNGKDLKGWTKRGGAADFYVEKGAIVGVSARNTPNTFLSTDLNYSDFIFEFEFSVDSALNSGVQFRANSTPNFNNGQVHGYQFDIDPSPRGWSGCIYDEGRSGWLYRGSDNPTAKSAYLVGEWNKGRIEAIGYSIYTYLNGHPVANLLDMQSISGFIALQVHSIGEEDQQGKRIHWRNLRICTKNPDKYILSRVDPAPILSNMPNQLTSKEVKAGWVLLWDGRTTSGWRRAKSPSFPAKRWQIENGLLKVVRASREDSIYGGDIMTVKRYHNFELKVDFRITDGADSGIKYFVHADQNRGDGSLIGCEYQIVDNLKSPDAALGIRGNRMLGSLYDLIPAPEIKGFRLNRFHTAHIIVRDNRVEHWLDGVKLIEYERNNQMFDALVARSMYGDCPNFGNAIDGYISLEDRGDEVWYKNIKIKELP